MGSIQVKIDDDILQAFIAVCESKQQFFLCMPSTMSVRLIRMPKITHLLCMKSKICGICNEVEPKTVEPLNEARVHTIMGAHIFLYTYM